MDLARLNKGLQVAGASAAGLLVVMFFPWYGRTQEAFPGVDQASVSANAWESFGFIDVVLFLIAASVIAIAAMLASGRDVRLPIGASTVIAALGILATVLVAYRLLDPPFDLDRRYGLYLGLLTSIGIIVGGRMSMTERGESFGQARDTVEAQVSDARERASDAIGEGSSGSSSSTRYEDRTKEELYEEATRREIDGRSEMSKEELIEALRRER